MKMRSKKKGFTLIEILIVIMIIAIILTFMGISVKGMQIEANISKTKGDLRTVQLAIEAYYKNHDNAFPPEENYQRTLLLVNPRVLQGNMFDPFAKSINEQYIYKLSPNTHYFVIYSLGMWRRGEASVSDSGEVTKNKSAICVTNGKIEDK